MFYLLHYSETSKVFIREKETRSRTEGLYETPESPTLRSPELARAQSIVGRERSIDEERIKKLKSIDFANQHTDDQIEVAFNFIPIIFIIHLACRVHSSKRT